MLCAIFSDSHGDKISLEKSILMSQRYGQIDYYLYLGDGLSDLYYIANKYNLNIDKDLIGIKGNNDYYVSGFDYERIETINGINVLLTHGNKYNVKGNLDNLYKKAKICNANIALYGHTHIQDISIKDNIYMVNPGSCFGKVNFALLEIGKNGIIYPVLIKE